jgi:Winged helix DNA-binding domain
MPAPTELLVIAYDSAIKNSPYEAGMTEGEIVRYRLVSQQIAATRYKTPAEVVSSLGAMQAQDYLGTLWAIGLRLPSATEKEVERAIEDRTIIRTWPLRSTLHFVAAADVHWFLELLGPRIISTEKGVED